MKRIELKLELPIDDDTDNDVDEVEAVTVRLKPLSKVPAEVMLANRYNGEQQMYDIFLWGFGDAQRDILGRIPLPDFQTIMDDWGAASEVTVGESGASSPPSKGTGRRSKPTSSETGSD
jgi:hypothetical protein